MKKKLFSFLTAVLAITALGACGNQSDATGDTEETAGSTAEKARTLTDAQGNEVEVPANPKRIIASYLEDYVVALGETPVAQWTVGSGSIQNYLQDELEDIPTISYDLPYEEVLSFDPDLLLVSDSSIVEGGKYAEYAKIAPAYVVSSGDDVTWKEVLEEVGTVLGKEDKAEEVLDDYQTLIDDTKKEYSDKIEGKSAAVLWVTNNSAFMVAEEKSSGRLLYGELGFEVPDMVKEVSEQAAADWSAVSLESLSQLDADYIFLVNSDEGAAMFEDSLWQNIPAVKNKQLFEFSPEKSWLYNGPIAYTKMIEDLQDVLS